MVEWPPKYIVVGIGAVAVLSVLGLTTIRDVRANEFLDLPTSSGGERYGQEESGCSKCLAASTSVPATGSSAVTTPPQGVFGSYRGGVPCQSQDRNNCALTSKNDIVIVSKTSKKTKAHIFAHITFDAGNACQIQGDAAWNLDKFTLYAEGVSDQQQCILDILIDNSYLTFVDQDQICEQIYCGAGGSFDGEWFRLSLPDR
jgi:hypothetical protein